MAAEQEDKYKAEKLGQLTAVSMLMIGRGPECLHLAVVRESFKQAQPHEIESIDDGQVMHDLLNIRNWNYDCLLDLSIIPGRKSKDPNSCKYGCNCSVQRRYRNGKSKLT